MKPVHHPVRFFPGVLQSLPVALLLILVALVVFLTLRLALLPGKE
jgi:hypothetical protein